MGQSRPLFFRRASLDRRLVFRILYYTVLPGPIFFLDPSTLIPGPVGESLRVNQAWRARVEDAKDEDKGKKSKMSENSREIRENNGGRKRALRGDERKRVQGHFLAM